MTIWAIDMPGIARRGDPPPRLREGRAGHPCASCGQESQYEWSPGRYRACRAECLGKQRPGPVVEQAVHQRHGVEALRLLLVGIQEAKNRNV